MKKKDNGQTQFKVGAFYEDKNNCFNGGYYLLLSYDYEEEIEHWAWRAAYFPFRIKNKLFKGAFIKTLYEVDVDKLFPIGNIGDLLSYW